jgi:hypothetical protein
MVLLRLPFVNSKSTPRKRTCAVQLGMSAMGQKQTLLYCLRRLCGQPNATRRMDKPA